MRTSHAAYGMRVTRSGGFTLIEIAVVMIIVGLVLGTMVQYLNFQLTGQRVSITQTRQEMIKSALINFLARNNRLPCPADPTLDEASPNRGVEARAANACTANLWGPSPPTMIVSTGSVPWATLGLSEETAADGYTNRFTYQVSRAATELTDQTVAGIKGEIELHSATPAADTNQTNGCPPAHGYNPCAAVVVIVSHGRNGFGAYTEHGQQIPVTDAGADEAENSDFNNVFIVRPYVDSGANAFDDIVLAMTANDLLAPLTRNGVIKDARAQTNAKADVIKWAVIGYAIANHVPGSSPPVYLIPAEDNDPAITPTNVVPSAIGTVPNTDPWGNKLRYTRHVAQIQPGDTTAAVYTLLSYGPDGQAGNDDITYDVSATEILAGIGKLQ